MDLLPIGSAGADAVCKRAPEAVRRSRRTFGVTGLKPGAGDALKAELALEQIPGVVHAYVNPVTEMAYIEYDPEQTSEDLLAAAIESAGFRTALQAGDL